MHRNFLQKEKNAFFLIRKLPFGRKAEELANIVIDMLMPCKKFVHSITSDNGTEFAEHIKMSKKLLTQLGYFYLKKSIF